MRVPSERERVNGRCRDNSRDILRTQKQINGAIKWLFWIVIVLGAILQYSDWLEYQATGVWPFHP